MELEKRYCLDSKLSLTPLCTLEEQEDIDAERNVGIVEIA